MTRKTKGRTIWLARESSSDKLYLLDTVEPDDDLAYRTFASEVQHNPRAWDKDFDTGNVDIDLSLCPSLRPGEAVEITFPGE